MKQHVLQIARLSLRYAEANLADIPDEKMTALPAGLVNHPAWIIGHIALAAERTVDLLGGQAACADECAVLFQDPPTEADGDFPAKADLLAAMRDVYARLEKAFEAASDELLARPLPVEEMREAFPTIGDMAVGVLTLHPALHLGQLAAWRTAMGMELPI